MNRMTGMNAMNGMASKPLVMVFLVAMHFTTIVASLLLYSNALSY